MGRIIGRVENASLSGGQFAWICRAIDGAFQRFPRSPRSQDDEDDKRVSRLVALACHPSIEELKLTVHDKSTSDRIAHLAAIVLKRANASAVEKELAGSALAQHHTSKHTSAQIGKIAAHVLGDRHACVEAKELAGSVLAQVRQHERASMER